MAPPFRSECHGTNGAFLPAKAANEIGSQGILTVPRLAGPLGVGELTFQWTADAPGYRLAETSALREPANWTDITAISSLTNGLRSLTLPTEFDAGFDCLGKP